MIVHSDWHIHSNASYDAKLPLETLIAAARAQGLRAFGVTDHLNFNDPAFIGNLRESAENFKRLTASCPEMVLGVELTPVAKPHYDHIAATGDRHSWVPVPQDTPYGIELGGTKAFLMSLGVRYAVGASHWRTDVADARLVDNGLDAQLREWYRQQMWLAQDERVTILGHPWDNGSRIWYADIGLIPRSMNEDIASMLAANHKFVELNSSLMLALSEENRHKYCEMIRGYFEKGVRVTYGSDCHGKPEPVYPDRRAEAEVYLAAAGFRDGDFSELTEEDLW